MEYLEVVYATQKSFYKKAIVVTEGSKAILYSYMTRVCSIEDREVKLENTNLYSTTTLRHMKEFLKQNGFKAESKKQILQDYSDNL